MRKRDWADATAEEFYNLISEHMDSEPEVVINRIGLELRKAFLAGTKQKQCGVVIDGADSGDLSRFIATANRSEPARDLLTQQYVLESSRGCKLTWDGQESKKRKSNG